MIGIYVNDSHERYTELILSGRKTYESRGRDVFKSLFTADSFGCCHALLIRTGVGVPEIVGRVLLHIGFPVCYEEYRLLYDDILVSENSPYYPTPGSTKYLYRVSQVETLHEPVPLSAFDVVNHGRSFCELKLKR